MVTRNQTGDGAWKSIRGRGNSVVQRVGGRQGGLVVAEEAGVAHAYTGTVSEDSAEALGADGL